MKILSLLFLLFFSLNAQEMFQTVPKEKAKLIKTDSSKEFCNVCGMNLVKYYKTNHSVEYKNGHKEQYCSLHCLAEVHRNYADKMKIIQVVDTNSLDLIDAKKAFYVIGSSKEGTMSAISEYAFSKKDEAEKFKKEFGGEIFSFKESLEKAKNKLTKENELLDKKRVQMAKKGKNIFEKMCNKIELPEFNAIGEAKKYIIDNSICKNLDEQMLQSVSIYLYDPILAVDRSKMIAVPEDAKCPVCGMFVAKYPKWVASISIAGHTHYFDGVKDMMKFYFNPSEYGHSHNKNEITKITVTDYYSITSFDGIKAFYVIGSNVYGPMGEELIPFKTLNEAKDFSTKHNGKKIVKFEEILENDL